MEEEVCVSSPLFLCQRLKQTGFRRCLDRQIANLMTNHHGNIVTADRHKQMILSLHLATIALSIVLIAMISYDTFRNKSFLADKSYMTAQFLICLFFIADIFIEWYLSADKRKYAYTHLPFLLVSIPYLNIVSYTGINLPCEAMYILRFIPLIRTAFLLAIVMAAFTGNRIASLFTTYIVTLIATVYFAGLMFFVEEHYINPDIGTFWSALWWAFMDVTTVGCNINAITPTGKILAVILSAEGLILFPVFTVYVTNALKRKRHTT